MSLINREYAIQVSDRRFVVHETDGRETFRDFENKSVIWCNRVAFAYTGIGNLGVRHATDQWLAWNIGKWEAERGQGDDQGALVSAIAQKATDYFRGPRISRLSAELRRHAFVAIGWAQFPDGDGFEPYIQSIHNFGPGGQTLDHFVGGGYRLEGRLDQSRTVCHGQELSDSERRQMNRQLETLPIDPEFAARASSVLADTVRAVAARNDRVGRGLLITVMPRGSILSGDTGGLQVAGGPLPDQQTFLYVPRDQDETVIYGPTVVCGGMAVSDFRAGPPEAFDS